MEPVEAAPGNKEEPGPAEREPGILMGAPEWRQLSAGKLNTLKCPVTVAL